MSDHSADEPATIPDWLDLWCHASPGDVWLRERQGDELRTWTWAEARDESNAIAAWLEHHFQDAGHRVAILSRNRAHWMLADMAICAAGQVSVPMFTTLTPDVARYILEFSGCELLVLGEAENWQAVREVLPPTLRILTLPGCDGMSDGYRWNDAVVEFAGSKPRHHCRHDELMSIIFTSGTTGNPKGVMQSHDSMLVPMLRCKHAFSLRANPRFLSYLPLSHVAERQLVWIQSLIYGGEVTFNESLATLVRDMAATRPNYFFGPPRVWEQLQLGIIARFGSQEQLDAALESGGEVVAAKIREGLGLHEADYLLTAAAPTPTALIEWYHRLGIALMEGYGQTEAMGLIANNSEDFRLGSIGRTVAGVEARISDSGELLVRAEGLAEGYYQLPGKTAETFVDGWVHTGDRARVDADGFFYITGRVKDYFKTIRGKFVSPVPIETEFARCRWVDQQCLLGRGYSKTVMVCVLSPMAAEQQRERITADLQALVEGLNQQVERHARIGGLIVTDQAWTIENGMLTPTLKLRREQVEAGFGEAAFDLARRAAEQGELLLAWEAGPRA